MSTLGCIFDTERIIRKYLVLMGLWLRNDILVLFIELFCSAYKSAISQQIYFFELTEAPYSFAFYLLSLKQMKILFEPPPVLPPLLNLFVYMHKVGLTSQKPKCQYFLKPWRETSDPVAAWHRTLDFGPMAETLWWLKVMPVKLISNLDGHLISK